MKKISLTQGLFALVDDEDYGQLSVYKWYAIKAGRTFYAVRNTRIENVGWRIIRMHRQILGLTDPKAITDHADGDGLNNQRYNLRACSKSENARNRDATKANTSGAKGVFWHKKNHCWVARIKFGGKLLHLGCFTDINAASLAYNAAAETYFGEFARLNDV